MNSVVSYQLYPNTYSYTLELNFTANITTLMQAEAFRSSIDEIFVEVDCQFSGSLQKGVIILDLTTIEPLWFVNPIILAHVADTFRVRTKPLLERFDCCVYLAPKIYKYSADLLLRLLPLTAKHSVYGFLPEERVKFEQHKSELENGRPYAKG